MEDEIVYTNAGVVTWKESTPIHATFGFTIRIEIAPMGAVRTTAKGQFTPRAKAYTEWKKAVQWLWVDALRNAGMDVNTPVPKEYRRMTFGIAIPDVTKCSVPEKRRRLDRIGKLHEGKPDLDNMMKGFIDALSYKKDDSHVGRIRCLEKIWAETGYIEVSF